MPPETSTSGQRRAPGRRRGLSGGWSWHHRSTSWTARRTSSTGRLSTRTRSTSGRSASRSWSSDSTSISSSRSPCRVRRPEEHTSELQSRRDLVCRLLLEKKKEKQHRHHPTTKKIKNDIYIQ